MLDDALGTVLTHNSSHLHSPEGGHNGGRGNGAENIPEQVTCSSRQSAGSSPASGLAGARYRWAGKVSGRCK